MGFFLAFLVLMTIVVPTFSLSRPERLALILIFALTLVSGALVTIGLRILRYVVIALTISAVTADMIAEFVPSLSHSEWDAALKLVCISILVFMTLKQTFRPGPVTVHRVMGGIAGYLLIGLTWMFAYQLVVEAVPGAIHFESPLEGAPAQQPTNLIYFSFCNPHDCRVRRRLPRTSYCAIIGHCRSTYRSTLPRDPNRDFGRDGIARPGRGSRETGSETRIGETRLPDRPRVEHKTAASALMSPATTLLASSGLPLLRRAVAGSLRSSPSGLFPIPSKRT